MCGGMRLRMRMPIALVAGCVLGLLAAAPGAGAVSLQPVGPGFDQPVFVTSPPGDPRLFVVERPGYIQVMHDGTVSQFLDIHTRTTDDGERGLLSMAFDPHYSTNGLFYVFYTGTPAADGGLGHVDEFHVDPGNPNLADLGSRRPVLTIDRPNTAASNHNGGQLQFGKDGYLYISVGDGGTGGSTAPDLTKLNGKILRIDPHGAGTGAHAIPPSNPFAGSATARQEIWSLGLRNPFRFSFDALTGDLVIGDVGEGTWEEVDFAPASSGGGRGANFGWPSCEGFVNQGTSTACSAPGTTAPVFAYPHSDPGGGDAFGCAILGGYVYRGTQASELAGRYLYADLCTAELRSLQLGNPFPTDRAESAPGALGSPRSFGEDSSCNLYVTNFDTVFRIVGSGGTNASACPSPPVQNCKCPATESGKKAKKCKKRKKKHRAADAKKHKKHKKCKKHKKHKKKHRK
jgi:glucose/arabinose dehydrogenase